MTAAEYDEYDRAVAELTDANIEVDMLRHVIERLTGGTVAAAVEKVASWDHADMEVIRLQQEWQAIR